MKRFLFVSLALVGMMATAPSAHAVLLGPGEGSPIPDAFAAETGVLVATASGALSNTGLGGDIDATYQEWVYREATGFLNFIYQVTVNAGSASLEQIAVTNFAGFGSLADSTRVDVGVTAVPLVGPPAALIGGDIPNAGGTGNVVTRSANGAVVNFQFTGGATGEVAPGEHTVLLTVQTNATVYSSGTITVQDGTSTFTTDLGPTAVPEPSTMALGGLGALGLIGYGLRRRKALGA